MFQLVAAGRSSALIPVISSVIATDGHQRAWRIVSTVTNLDADRAGRARGHRLRRCRPRCARVHAGFDPDTLALTIQLTRIMVWTDLPRSRCRRDECPQCAGTFAARRARPSIYNIVIIAATLTLAPSIGAVGLAIGVVVGSLGHLLVQLPALRRIGFRYQPLIDLRDAAARQALLLMAPRAIGLGRARSRSW